LLDYPNNIEIGDTSDLEESMDQLGFTTPIEVTAFGQPEGKYMIISGHRRRAAGVKLGMTEFKCIVRVFKSEAKVNNYVLLANNQRDSVKDPFLYCALWKKHEEYLIESGFEGNIRKEIAKRLGISVQQADRYNTLYRVIQPVWVLIKDNLVGMSSVMPMASHTEEQQIEIYAMLNECMASGDTLTRETVKKIVDGYRDGKKSYSAVVKSGEKDGGTKDIEIKGEKPPISDEERESKTAQSIVKSLERLNTCFNDGFKFANADEAEQAIKLMSSVFEVVADEMYGLKREFGLDDAFVKAMDKMHNRTKFYSRAERFRPHREDEFQ